MQRSVALLPWSHNVYLLGKNLDDSATLYYAQETIAKGWNRDLLLNAIKLNMYESQLATKVDNNFSRTLPMEQAQYANEVFSSSYNLGFLGVTSPILKLERSGTRRGSNLRGRCPTPSHPLALALVRWQALCHR